MRLLLVDDEKLTQQGIVNSINWSDFGIEEVLVADDGQQGLELAREYHPEIILCDVRMPRMTGIEMIEKILAFSPDSVPILISGYSDKEYLKAAIKLKALSYIEKPLNIPEVEETLREAVRQYQTSRRYRQNELNQMQSDKAALALLFSMPRTAETENRILQLIGKTKLHIDEQTSFETWVVKLARSEQISLSSVEKKQKAFCELIRRKGLNVLYTQKHTYNYIFFIYSNFRISEKESIWIGQTLKKSCTDVENFYVSKGRQHKGIWGAYESYSEAALLLESSFFFPNKMILTPDMPESKHNMADFRKKYPHYLSEFASALEIQNQGECKDMLDLLYHYSQRSLNMLPNDVKDVYYRLFILIQEAEQNLYVSSSLPRKDSDAIMSYLDEFETLDQVSRAISQRMEAFFEQQSSFTKESPMIYQIKEYIADNYTDESLSVRDISEYVDRSVSYICSFFKSETGKTLNQYITEYRILRAKQLLKDPEIKISTVSRQVGYSDGNYFAKLFRKMEGVSPSAYRGNMIDE
ncbi:MAG: response regulator [Eubacterium sp.]|nr:response regulator [Eubacterium sp.]